jgi:hypothetical protein
MVTKRLHRRQNRKTRIRKRITRRKSNRRRYFGGSPRKRKFVEKSSSPVYKKKKLLTRCPYCIARGDVPKTYYMNDEYNSHIFIEQNYEKEYKNVKEREHRIAFWKDVENSNMLDEIAAEIVDNDMIDLFTYNVSLEDLTIYEPHLVMDLNDETEFYRDSDPNFERDPLEQIEIDRQLERKLQIANVKYYLQHYIAPLI